VPPEKVSGNYKANKGMPVVPTGNVQTAPPWPKGKEYLGRLEFVYLYFSSALVVAVWTMQLRSRPPILSQNAHLPERWRKQTQAQAPAWCKLRRFNGKPHQLLCRQLKL
jgi:hypothetical protein